MFEDHLSYPQELLAAQFLKLARRLGYGGPLGMQALRWAQRQTPLHSRHSPADGDAEDGEIGLLGNTLW